MQAAVRTDGDGLDLTLEILFDPYSSGLILEAYDHDDDEQLSPEEQQFYGDANLELALDLIEVSAGSLQRYYTNHRRLDAEVLAPFLTNPDEAPGARNFFGVVKARPVEQFYLFNDRTDSTDFLITATNEGFRAEVQSQGEGEPWLVKVQVTARYPWPDHIPLNDAFGCKVELRYNNINICSAFLPVPPGEGVDVLDQLLGRPADPATMKRGGVLFEEPMFNTLPKSRRCILLLKKSNDPHKFLP